VFEENREIKELEKQLHMNKRKSKSLPKKFVEEGLDCIFYFSILKYNIKCWNYVVMAVHLMTYCINGLYELL